jgi:hypothetical protein
VLVVTRRLEVAATNENGVPMHCRYPSTKAYGVSKQRKLGANNTNNLNLEFYYEIIKLEVNMTSQEPTCYRISARGTNYKL